MRSDLTIDDARKLDHEDLIERCEAILSTYDPPEVETQAQKIERLSLTIDEIPQVYRWFLQLESYFEHWTAGGSVMWGQSDRDTKRFRQRKELFKSMASAAKQRYEGASRLVTVMESFDPTGLPRQRVMR